MDLRCFLTLVQLIELRNALLSAFPTKEDLEGFMASKMYKEEILWDCYSLKDMIDRVVVWAVENRRVVELIQNAWLARNDNHALRFWVASLQRPELFP